MHVTFHNVSILIEASDPKEAYRKLCKIMGTDQIAEWSTDTFSVDTEEKRTSTQDIFPTL